MGLVHKSVIAHYEDQTEEKAVAEDEAAVLEARKHIAFGLRVFDVVIKRKCECS
jgi:hypothetical protein